MAPPGYGVQPGIHPRLVPPRAGPRVPPMSTSAQFTFAAEFVAFLAAAAGLAMALLRGEVVVRPAWARTPLGAGFGFLAGAAFLRGSLLIDTDTTRRSLRCGSLGLLIVIVGSLAWDERGPARQLLWVALRRSRGRHLRPDAGRLAVGRRRPRRRIGRHPCVSAHREPALARRARRGVGCRRAAADGAGVVARAVGRAVLDRRARSQRSPRRTGPHRGRPCSTRKATSRCAGPVWPRSRSRQSRGALLFEAGQDSRSATAALTKTSPSCPTSSCRTCPSPISAPTARCLAPTGFDPASLVPIAGSATVAEARDRGVGSEHRRGRQRRRDRAGRRCRCWPTTPGGRSHLGTVVAAVAAQRLVPQRRARATTRACAWRWSPRPSGWPRRPSSPPSARARALSRQRAGQRACRARRQFDGLFFSVRPVEDAGGTPVMVLVATTPTTLVDDTRESLFRTLFLIALGGTLLALMLAAFVGERIGARVRRLTVAATAIQEGDLTVRAGLDASDEVGVLGSTFDAMAQLARRTDRRAAPGGRGRGASAQPSRSDRRRSWARRLSRSTRAGRVTDFNQAAEELIGVSASTARGRPATDVLQLVTDEGVDLSLAAAPARSPRRWSSGATLTPRDGKTVPVVVSGGALRGPSAELAGARVRVARPHARTRSRPHEDRVPLPRRPRTAHAARRRHRVQRVCLTRRNMTPEQAKPRAEGDPRLGQAARAHRGDARVLRVDAVPAA